MPVSDAAHAAPLARAGLDRAGAERADPALLDRLRDDPRTRVIVVRGESAAMATPTALSFSAPSELDAPAHWAFLGRDRDHAAVLAAVYAADDPPPVTPTAGWAPLRAVGGDLDPVESGVFVQALSLGRWLRDAPYCAACGARTVVADAGWSRRCPSCGREHFPRTDPAVIVAVTSAADPDRLLLGSNALWPPGRYSCFAGFVEAGESLEAAVAREVREESGIEVAAARYRSSQAWPYPRSLMLGFLAVAADDDAARADGDEIAAVRWFTRAEIAAALADEGDLQLPGRASIAHRLISDWCDAAA